MLLVLGDLTRIGEAFIVENLKFAMEFDLSGPPF
jgi:hypothetical protein